MINTFHTVLETGYGEVTEKRSRFLSVLSHVSSEEEALAFIAEISKKYRDARHNCYAYIIGGENPVLRGGDDGEPSGTAGRPMLEVLKGRGLSDVCVVVTRYFGGILLGTGGLARAYTAAAEAACDNALLVEMTLGTKLIITAGYQDTGRIQYLISQVNARVLSADYTDKVVFTVILPEDKGASFAESVITSTSRRAQVEVCGTEYY